MRRESGFYWVRWEVDREKEVARWWIGDGWERLGLALRQGEPYEVFGRCYPSGETPPEITSPAEQPVTMAEVARVLRAYRLEDPAINRAVLTLHPDERGYIDASACQPFAAEWSDVAHLSRIIRAALANLDAPPKPSTLDVMRGTK